MSPTELQPGLWRWTAAHPDWRADAPAGSSAQWPQEVGCVLYETPEAAVFIDALIPAGQEPAFWRWADARCEGRAVHALSTISFHARSRAALVERYGAVTSRARRALPQGVQSRPLKGAGETLFWLPGPRALIAGDRLIGFGPRSLSVCPESWLQYLDRPLTLTALKELLRPLLELPIEAVLVSHGEPILGAGRAALARALA